MERPRLFRTAGQWASLAVATLLGAGVLLFVDLEPRVEADFFFDADDPQLRSSRLVESTFGSTPQVFVAVRARDVESREYLERLHDLTAALEGVEGVSSVRSVTQGPLDPGAAQRDPERVFRKVRKRPFWNRLLLAPDGGSTSVVVGLEPGDRRETLREIDAVLDRFRSAGLELGASGVPYVSEHVRLELTRDLETFSVAALAAFTLLVSILFRSLAVVIGTMVTSLAACFGTFVVRALLGMHSGILTPNLWTIAFVLTLSHVVYLTASHRRLARTQGPRRALRTAIGLTGPAALWSLVALLLGFASLMLVSARPLRDFGISGAIAALVAIACAYGLYPPFLLASPPPPRGGRPVTRRLERFFTARHGWIACGVVIAALALAPWSRRVNTDPTLTSYFGEGGAIREGLLAVDRSTGSSPLDLVIRDAAGGSLADDESFERVVALQRALEEHPDVGSVVSIALLMQEADRPWYSFLASWKKRFQRLDSPKHERVGRTFVSADRRLGRFILRMREDSRDRPRAEVVSEIRGIARSHGFEPVVIGGLYPLQGKLSELVEASVLRGLGGLAALFFVIALLVSRSLRTALAMAVALALVPLALFGLVGLVGMPLDIISAPAANVALPMGIDEMIHLAHAVRRRRSRGGAEWAAWRRALAELWMPILFSVLIVAAGFALFLLSSFPPTRRLGVLACVGAVLTDVVVLVVLPAIATRRR